MDIMILILNLEKIKTQKIQNVYHKKQNNYRSGLKLSPQIIYSFILDDIAFQVSEYDCKLSLKKISTLF